MIHEWRSYRLKPGAATPYLELLADHGLPYVTQHLPLMGYWLAETGPLNVIHHLWSYTDWAEREACRAALAGEEAWMKGFIPKAFAMVEEQQNRMLGLLSGSDAFEEALRDRRRALPARQPGSPLFAAECSILVAGQTRIQPIASWETRSGAPSPPLSLLPRSADPISASQSKMPSHLVLRPVAFSRL